MPAPILTATRQQAAQARAEQDGNYGRPRSRRWHETPGSAALARAPQRPMSLRAAAAGGDLLEFEGYASVTETGYDMWDWYGVYTEIVSAGAFDLTLSRSPDVAFLLNHGGMTLARTTSGTCQLVADEVGLLTRAQLDARQTVVRDVQIALDRRDLTEMSFAFGITRGHWSPDYTEYRIDEVDIDRGDVSIVNYGANPATSASLRSGDILHALDSLDSDGLAAARARIDGRLATAAADVERQAPAAGMSLATARARAALTQTTGRR